MEKLRNHLAELSANGARAGHPVRQLRPARPVVGDAREPSTRRWASAWCPPASRFPAPVSRCSPTTRSSPATDGGAGAAAHRRALGRGAVAAQARRLRRARGPRRRRLPRHEAPDARRAGDGLPRALVRREGRALRAGAPALAGLALRRGRGRAAGAPPARFGAVAEDQGPRAQGHPGHGRRAAQGLRRAPRAPGLRLQARHRLAARARGLVPLRRDARPAQGHRGRAPRHGDQPAPWTA